jgi:hypothetical protein
MLAIVAAAGSHTLRLVAAFGLVVLAHPGPAAAEEQTLRFRLVVQPVEVPDPLPEIGGHKVSAGKYMGVAVFEDGRIAHKRFVHVSDDTADGGSFKGYSTYTFENGDSLILGYTGQWDANGLSGFYQVISGTGEFAGATGTGSFKNVDDPWDVANLLDGSFTITLATR